MDSPYQHNPWAITQQPPTLPIPGVNQQPRMPVALFRPASSQSQGGFPLPLPLQIGQVLVNQPRLLPPNQAGQLLPAQLNPVLLPPPLLNHTGQFPRHLTGCPVPVAITIQSAVGMPMPSYLTAPRWSPAKAVTNLPTPRASQRPMNPPTRHFVMQAPQQGFCNSDQSSTCADPTTGGKRASVAENLPLGIGVKSETEYLQKEEKLLRTKRPANEGEEAVQRAKKQRREGPKAPAWKIKAGEAVDVSDQFALEDVNKDAFKKEAEKETDPHRLAQRQKQIDFGKNTLGYERYLELVPKSKRQKEHPRTPRIGQVCSKRSWDGQIKKWRRLLHQYDPPADEEAEVAVQDFLPGYGKKKLDDVEKDKATSAGEEGSCEKGKLDSNQALVFEDDEDEFVGL